MATTHSLSEKLDRTENAVSASQLLTARTIAISGGATGTATAFDGTANITIPITALNMGNATAGTLPVARGGTGTTTSTGTGNVVLSASPTFTGTPLSTTAADGTNTTQLATTAFVQAAVGGYLAKAVTGGTVTLTDAEASNPVIALTGTLTSNLNLVVPVTVKRLWAVFNSTAGAFTVTVKTASGTGVLVAQGKRNLVYTDGTNVLDGFNDFNDIAITGNSTATTQAAADNSTKIATTAFVKAAVSSGSATGADKLTTARNINNVPFDGTANIDIQWKAIAIPGTSDLNTYQNEGVFVCAANATAATLVNSPTVNAFAMRVWKSAGVIQEITEYLTTNLRKTYQRSYYSNVWSAWNRVYTTIDEQPLVDALRTARTIAISGAVTGTATAFDGTANITIPITALNMSSATTGTLAVARGGTGVTSSTGTGSVVLSASPTFTGAPLTTTAADGTNTTQIASTAFVQAAVGGYLAKTVTGGTVTLTDAEASNPVIALTGTLTSNLNLVVPVTVKRLWAIYNSTAGGFTVTVKTASGTGVTVAQGKRNLVYTDGTNVLDGFNDFENIAITGNSTATTQTATDNSTRIATTAFVQAVTNSDTGGSATTLALKNARTIAISGGATGTATSFDGTANITIPITALNMGNATAGTLAVARGGTGVTTSTGTGSVVLSASPTFTGTPLSVTAADGTNTTQIATTAFVQAAVGGYLAKAVTGGTVTLTDAEASNPVIALTGTLTSNLNLVVPVTVKRLWAFFNNTSGAFTVTVKTASGTGVTVAQGKRNLVYTDGTNVLDGFNDFESIAITGNSTAITQATSDNSTRIATTAYVQAVSASDTGSSATTLALKNARTIAISGAVTGTATSFDGTANITIPITALNMSSATTGTLAVARGGTGVTTSTGTGNVVLSASPTFTGTPLSTTAADGTNTTQIATTAFVQAAVGGYLSKAVTGGTVTLTDAEASNPVIALTGTLTSNLSLVVPATVKRLWAIYNNTGGAFTVTVKLATGTGVTVAQGKRNLVFTDGTNVYDGFNDFESIAITGTSTAPTAAYNTNTTQLATTAFVQAAKGAFGGGTDQVFYLNDNVVTTSYTIPASHNAMTAGPITVNNGVVVTIPDGCAWTIV